MSEITPIEVDAAMLAFPANVMGKYLPAKEDIPEEFWSRGNPWAKLVSTWFYSGLPALPVFREGVDPVHATRHLHVCMRSYEPKHEHKTAGVAYLMSLWCESPNIPDVDPAVTTPGDTS